MYGSVVSDDHSSEIDCERGVPRSLLGWIHMGMIKRLLQFVGLLPKINYNSVEYQRSRGAYIGEDVELINCKIDDLFQYLLKIGNHVTITGATILTHDASTKRELGYTKAGRVVIGDNVFIGNGAIILPNTQIGNRVIVGAGTVVAKNIPDNSVVVGNPCRVICTYDEYMDKMKRKMSSDKVFDSYPDSLSKDTKREQASGDIETTYFVL